MQPRSVLPNRTLAPMSPRPAQRHLGRPQVRSAAPEGSGAAPTQPAPAGGAAPAASSSGLASKRCLPCEAGPADAGAAGGHPAPAQVALTAAEPSAYLGRLHSGWRLVEEDQKRLRIRRRYRTKNFAKGMDLLRRVAEVAEAEGHHPDLSLEGWNNAAITLLTHSQGGLTDNDFVLAAKVDALDTSDLISKRAPLEDP